MFLLNTISLRHSLIFIVEQISLNSRQNNQNELNVSKEQDKEKMLKTETFAKLFFLVSFTGLLMYVVLAFYTFHTAYTAISQVQKFREIIQNNPTTNMDINDDRFINDLKYILLWPVANVTHNSFPDGQSVFINYNCSYINCYLTSNKYLLNGDYRNFEAIVLNASIFTSWDENLPERRLNRQKYIFYSEQPSDSSPMCNICAENYFNWTWTYKFSSDIFRPLIEVRDMNNKIVAPSEKVKWITKEINSTASNNSIVKVGHVKKAVASIINNCENENETIVYAKKLRAILDRKSLDFDLYGCTFLKCLDVDCVHDIKNNYYFYLVYEESFAVDYVSATVVKAYDAGAVPIIAGGANYHKFLPDGSYITTRHKSVEDIAETIESIIENPSTYNDYHEWRKHYIIKQTRQLEGICDLCSHLNNMRKFNKRTAIKNFRYWWYYGSRYEKCKIDPDPSENTRHILKEFDLVTYFKQLKSHMSFEENN